MEEAAEDDTVQVDRLQVVRQEGALQAEHIPPADLVSTGHGEQPGALHHSVPGLQARAVLHWDGSLPALYLGPQLPPRLPVGVAVIALAGQVPGLLVRREDPGVTAGRRVDVEMKSDLILECVAAPLCFGEDTVLLQPPSAARYLLKLGVQEVHQTPPGNDLSVAVIESRA